MPALTLSWPQPQVALLTFDLPGKRVNLLSRSVLAEFAEKLELLNQRPGVAGLILTSGKPDAFFAGADITEFSAALHKPKSEVYEHSRQGQQLFAMLSQLEYPTIAAIDGICLGGGAELAAWCDRRIFSSNAKTQIGFPEVKLGLIPGWGGTVRTPRLVGLANALQMICGGESLSARAAMQMGWGSDLVPAEQLLPAALRILAEEHRTRAYLKDRERLQRPLELHPTEADFLRSMATVRIQEETKGQFPAPQAALELMLATQGMPAEQALELESERMTELFGGLVNRALVNVYFLTDYNKRQAGEGSDQEIRSIHALGVIGAGIMGSGIAAAGVKSELPTTMIDAIPLALEKGTRAVIEEVAFDKHTKQPDAERALRFAPLLHTGSIEADLAATDLVIEAVSEVAVLKRQVFSRLESAVSPETILASNTSSIPITKLAASLQHPHRFCGIHFFNPVRRMKLVEVVRGEKTSDATVASVVAFVKRIGKMPIVVNDGPGFVVNRMLSAYLNETLELVLEGVSLREVDQAALDFGMPIGPIALYDLVGIDTAIQVGRTMYESFSGLVKISPIIVAVYKAGRYGIKTGEGFYSYKNKQGVAQDDPEVEKILARYRGEIRHYSAEQITQRLVLSMLLEAVRVLDEGIARNPRDIDLGLIYGLGFPTFRGGLLYWADTLGLPQILKLLEDWSSIPRMQPPASLVERASRGERFYELGAGPA